LKRKIDGRIVEGVRKRGKNEIKNESESPRRETQPAK